LINKEQSWLSD